MWTEWYNHEMEAIGIATKWDSMASVIEGVRAVKKLCLVNTHTPKDIVRRVREWKQMGVKVSRANTALFNMRVKTSMCWTKRLVDVLVGCVRRGVAVPMLHARWVRTYGELLLAMALFPLWHREYTRVRAHQPCGCTMTDVRRMWMGTPHMSMWDVDASWSSNPKETPVRDRVMLIWHHRHLLIPVVIKADAYNTDYDQLLCVQHPRIGDVSRCFVSQMIWIHRDDSRACLLSSEWSSSWCIPHLSQTTYHHEQRTMPRIAPAPDDEDTRTPVPDDDTRTQATVETVDTSISVRSVRASTPRTSASETEDTNIIPHTHSEKDEHMDDDDVDMHEDTSTIHIKEQEQQVHCMLDMRGWTYTQRATLIWWMWKYGVADESHFALGPATPMDCEAMLTRGYIGGIGTVTLGVDPCMDVWDLREYTQYHSTQSLVRAIERVHADM
jgi:hypothetical protein